MDLMKQFVYEEYLAAKKQFINTTNYINKCFLNEADINLLLEEDGNSNAVAQKIDKSMKIIEKYFQMFMDFIGKQFTKQRMDYLNNNTQNIINAAQNSTITLDMCPNYDQAIKNLQAFQTGISNKIQAIQVENLINNANTNTDADLTKFKQDLALKVYSDLIGNGIKFDNVDECVNNTKKFLMGGDPLRGDTNKPLMVKSLNIQNIINFLKTYNSYVQEAKGLIEGNKLKASVEGIMNKINANGNNASTPAPNNQPQPQGNNNAKQEEYDVHTLALIYRNIINETFLNEDDNTPTGQGQKKPDGTGTNPQNGNTGSNTPKSTAQVSDNTSTNQSSDNKNASQSGTNNKQPDPTNPDLVVSKNNNKSNDSKLKDTAAVVITGAVQGVMKAYLKALSELNNDGFNLCKLLVPINTITGSGSGTQQPTQNQQQQATQQQSPTT